MSDSSRWIVVLAVAALTPIVAAQVDWQQRDVIDTSGPVACDVLRGQLLLQTDSQTAAQTWLWNGVHWLRAHPSSSPPPGAGQAFGFQALAYDAGRGVVVLFNRMGQTWEWNG